MPKKHKRIDTDRFPPQAIATAGMKVGQYAMMPCGLSPHTKVLMSNGPGKEIKIFNAGDLGLVLGKFFHTAKQY